MVPLSRLLFATGSCSAWLTLGVILGACGGSSSETPFPLEPDPRELAAGAPRQGRHVEHEEERGESGESDEAGRAAPSTWGSGRPKPLPAGGEEPAPEPAEPELPPEKTEP